MMARSDVKDRASNFRSSRAVGVLKCGVARNWTAVLLIVTILVAWETGVRAGLLEDYLFPPPSKILGTFEKLQTEGFPPGHTVTDHIAATLPRVLKGYLLAAVVALPIGLAIGRVWFIRDATVPLVTFFRSIAVISLLPLSLALFGPGETARVALIFYATFWIVLTNTMEGAQRVPASLIRAGQALGASGIRLYLRVMLPATLPKIFSGLKVALGVAWVVIVAVELIGTDVGVGALISNAQRLYRTDIVISGMVVIGVIGLLLAVFLDWLERRLLPWATAANSGGARR